MVFRRIIPFAVAAALAGGCDQTEEVPKEQPTTQEAPALQVSVDDEVRQYFNAARAGRGGYQGVIADCTAGLDLLAQHPASSYGNLRDDFHMLRARARARTDNGTPSHNRRMMEDYLDALVQATETGDKGVRAQVLVQMVQGLPDQRIHPGVEGAYDAAMRALPPEQRKTVMGALDAQIRALENYGDRQPDLVHAAQQARQVYNIH